MTLFKKSVKTFSWSFLGSGLGFVFQLLIARILGASEFGKANVILGFVGTYYTLLNFGLPTLLIRESAKNKNNSINLFSNFFYLYFILDIIFLPVIYFTLRYSLRNIGLWNIFNIVIILLIIFLTQTANLLYAYFIGIKKQNYTSFLRDTLTRLIRIFSFFLIYIFISNYISYILAALISFFVPLFIALFRIKKIKNIKIKWILINSWQFYLISITYTLYNSLSKILQKLYATNETVGYLSVGITLGSIGVILGSSLASVSMPEFAHAWKEKNMKKIDLIFKEVSRWNAYVMLPIVIFLLLNIKRILEFLGKDYANGTIIVSIILISQFLNSFVGPNGTLLNMSGYQRFEIYNGIAMIITGTTIGILLGPKFSWGIAVSLAIATIIVNLLKFIEVGIIHKIYPYNIKTFVYIILEGFYSFILFLLFKKINQTILWFLLNSILILVTIIFTFRFSPNIEDRNIIKKFINKILR
ncbi:lipopolysaccharide biosynthesis protein [Marinitoga sp. 1155]|uniref:lipopolysaccharide biosynthesis protein n=1 Tax=Marinitoga sp. 1155 TaxID=1428448 RepID=UPI000640BAE0|nr:oligosaccharide flippase family protein [Marinitoga sp. 1155]KLO21174.1 hypothetical protein X274_10860 [Marinitoga sp. 1155]